MVHLFGEMTKASTLSEKKPLFSIFKKINDILGNLDFKNHDVVLERLRVSMIVLHLSTSTT